MAKRIDVTINQDLINVEVNRVNLDNYYTKTETNILVSGITVDLTEYYTKTETNTLLSGVFTEQFATSTDSTINSGTLNNTHLIDGTYCNIDAKGETGIFFSNPTAFTRVKIVMDTTDVPYTTALWTLDSTGEWYDLGATLPGSTGVVTVTVDIANWTDLIYNNEFYLDLSGPPSPQILKIDYVALLNDEGGYVQKIDFQGYTGSILFPTDGITLTVSNGLITGVTQ